ncbi:MAG: peptide protein [Sphingobacteriales bacterium]|nr:peptide protein [Sphingobacteriales bacterium]
MIQKIYSFLLILMCTLPAYAQNKDAVLGKWLSETGEGEIQVYKKGDHYFGKLVWLKYPDGTDGKPKVDSRNPDPAKQKRTINGLELLQGFTYSEDNVWENGNIYDPKTGKTYSCKLTLVGNNKLNIRGFIGISLLGRTEKWTRVK